MLANCKCHVCGEIIPLAQPIYCYDDKDGIEQTYHMECFCSQTVQGVQGFKPTKIYQPIGDDSDETDSFGF